MNVQEVNIKQQLCLPVPAKWKWLNPPLVLIMSQTQSTITHDRVKK